MRYNPEVSSPLPNELSVSSIVVTVSSPSRRSSRRSSRRPSSPDTHTLAHSDTAPSRQAHTHSHLVPLKVTGEQPAQPLGLYSGHSGRSRASRTLSAGLVLASLQSSPPYYHRATATATPPPHCHRGHRRRRCRHPTASRSRHQPPPPPPTPPPPQTPPPRRRTATGIGSPLVPRDWR